MKITKIEEVHDHPYKGYDNYLSTADGFIISLSSGLCDHCPEIVKLLINNDQQCCECSGYFFCEDDPQKFIGAEFYGVKITDTELNTRVFKANLLAQMPNGEHDEEYRGTNTLFVDIETDGGVLQFVAYNNHNGYYGHDAMVISEDLSHRVVL